MEISEYDGSKLRLILIGMITDPKVCSRISSIMDKPKGPRFNQEWADLIAKWCREHLRKYSSPPNGNINLIFRRWAETATNKKTVLQVEALLQYMSEEYSGSVSGNSDFVLDIASEYFNTHRLRSVVEEVEGRIDEGDVEKAYAQLSTTSKIELGYSTVINPLKDIDVWLDTFNEERRQPLFEYPGPLGNLLGPSMTKGSFVSFMGVDKSGKSYYLLDAAFRALKRRRRVAYFEVGDLGREETIERLGQRILHEPLDRQIIEWPVGWEEGTDTPIYEKRLKHGFSIGDALKKIKRYTRDRDLMRLSCHPNSSINVAGITSYLDEWARESCWIPDLVCIDYADILAPPQGQVESKDQIDETWKQLRRLSQTYNCLVLTATQTGAQAYRKKGTALGRVDFSGRKTKLAHVTGMIGINATPDDRRNNVTRVNWIVRRKGRAHEMQQIIVAGCLDCGCPIVTSKNVEWRKPKTTETLDDSED